MLYVASCVGAFLFGYLLNMLYITVFYHRGLTHRSVELSPMALRIVRATGNWVTGLDPKGWSVMHRLHHLHSDTPEDPHSPKKYGVPGVMLAQLHSYKRVLRSLKSNDPALAEIAPDLDFPVHWLNRRRLWILPYLLHLSIWVGLGLAFDAWALGYCYFAGIMSHPIQGWMVNALGHSYGYRTFELPDDSRNNTMVAWLAMGEGYQNNHHRFPQAAKFSIRQSEVDLGYGLCRALAALGVIRIPAQPDTQKALGEERDAMLRNEREHEAAAQ